MVFWVFADRASFVLSFWLLVDHDGGPQYLEMSKCRHFGICRSVYGRRSDLTYVSDSRVVDGRRVHAAGCCRLILLFLP